MDFSLLLYVCVSTFKKYINRLSLQGWKLSKHKEAQAPWPNG
jgi:hypothetical protein